jgi:hypothetical protein
VSGTKIRFRQTGGFAGLARGCDLDAADLPRAEADELAHLLATARLEAVKPGRARGADRQQYDLVLEREGEPAITVRFDDAALTDELAALVAFLRKRSRPVPLR